MIGQCNKTPVEPIDQPEVQSDGKFVVDTVKIAARIDSSKRIEGYARIVVHFEHFQGVADQLTFVVNQWAKVAIVDYDRPLEMDRYYPWTPSLAIEDTGEDSVTIQCRISGAFWKPESSWYKTVGTFSWSDSQRVFVVR